VTIVRVGGVGKWVGQSEKKHQGFKNKKEEKRRGGVELSQIVHKGTRKIRPKLREGRGEPHIRLIVEKPESQAIRGGRKGR